MTYYLKYRPQSVRELNIKSVRDRLANIVDKKNFSHAYLFFGPRGTGKTSAARILAREAGAKGIDIIEMDAASNRGIDDIRELRERVGLTGAEGDKKVYIIDEVHMLTAEAFNALLKTLEEPPAHVIFFLCTTEFHKLPETIVSRCVSVQFTKASVDEIVESLARTVSGEKLKIDKKALSVIAEAVDGSFREAQTILEEAAAAAGGQEIEIKEIEGILGGSTKLAVESYVDSILTGDAKQAIEAVESVANNSGDMAIFSKRILISLKNRLIDGNNSASGKPDLDRLLVVAKVVESRVRTVRYSALPQLPLIIAALELKLDLPSSSRAIPEIAASSFDRLRTPRNDITLEALLAKWPEVLNSVRQKNHGIVTLLSNCRPLAVDSQAVTLEVRYKFHKEQLEQQKFRLIIEQIIGQVFDSPLAIKVKLGDKTKTVLKEFVNDDNIRAVSDTELSSIAEEIFST